ncbi:MAG: poly-beta-hydroxybutyrate polymerase [Deltaproteobacteria bacterium]|nr:MAG: poly-beta-hydroxybutyrate polymerase [Deltaproteobacteria bacterium]
MKNRKPIKLKPDASFNSEKEVPEALYEERPKDEMKEAAYRINRTFRKKVAEITGPVDIPAFARSFYDGMIHLAWSPGTLLQKYLDSMELFSNLGMACFKDEKTSMKDRRFRHELWDKYPFVIYKNIFLTIEPFIQQQYSQIRGVQGQSKLLIEFWLKQITAMINPMNFPFTNPAVMEKTYQEKGMNLVKGFATFLEDLRTSGTIRVRHSREEYQKVGETLAATRGKVVFRNELIELIQFEPETKKVKSTPVLLVPAWINKYYILDLRPVNSLARYLVEKGFTVFIISWKNINSIDYIDFGLIEYTRNGLIKAIEEIKLMLGVKDIHIAGYCMGAVLCTIAAAYLRGRKDESIKTMTFFAAQIGFADAGDLKSFIDESQIAFLEDLMIDNGYLEKTEMGNTFSLLKPRDLFWNFLIDTYFLGQEPVNFDFLYWNDDGTKMPKKLHLEILKRLYLDDELTEGKFRIGEKSLDLRDIDMDLFSVGTEKDHIAPWRSVYRIPHFISSPIKFVLASSGHVAGIINAPYDKKGHYFTDGILGKGPDYWLETAKMHKGSWWPEWIDWLEKRSGEEVIAPKCPVEKKYDLGDAPGTYVFEK